jgi:hypothetical protein
VQAKNPVLANPKLRLAIAHALDQGLLGIRIPKSVEL